MGERRHDAAELLVERLAPVAPVLSRWLTGRRRGWVELAWGSPLTMRAGTVTHVIRSPKWEPVLMLTGCGERAWPVPGVREVPGRAWVDCWACLKFLEEREWVYDDGGGARAAGAAAAG